MTNEERVNLENRLAYKPSPVLTRRAKTPARRAARPTTVKIKKENF